MKMEQIEDTNQIIANIGIIHFGQLKKNINKDMPMITSNSTMLQIAAVIFHTVTALGLMRFCGSRRKFFPPLSPSVKNYVSFRQKVSNI
jgi:hypothetical protein